jgi:hypothetical protein
MEGTKKKKKLGTVDCNNTTNEHRSQERECNCSLNVQAGLLIKELFVRSFQLLTKSHWINRHFSSCFFILFFLFFDEKK